MQHNNLVCFITADLDLAVLVVVISHPIQILKLEQFRHTPNVKSVFNSDHLATVPYLGRGPPRPVLEARLQQGAMINDTKSCKTITETSFGNYSSTPLLPTVQATIQNPHNLVEGVAAAGWIRGGLPSRELTRDQDYLERQTHSQ